MAAKIAYTTGTYATGAVKGALSALLSGQKPIVVDVRLPAGGIARIEIEELSIDNGVARCTVVKRSCEPTDVTHNLAITAEVSLREDSRIVLRAGTGIGVVTRKGLSIPQGSPAINPTPRRMINRAVRELTSRGVDITLSAPQGVKLAQRTWNPRLGIEGGISIIGTTGIMRAKSAPAYKSTIEAQLKLIAANDKNPQIIITPGNISERAMAERFAHGIDPDTIVQAGDFLGFALKRATLVTDRIVVAGHPAKLAKTIEGYFQTHYSRSPQAKDMVIRFLKGRVDDALLRELSDMSTVEGIIQTLRKRATLAPMDELSELIEENIKGYLQRTKPIPVILFDMERRLIGLSDTARQWIERGYT